MLVADDDDIARLFTYHGFEALDAPEGIYVKGSNPCEHLRMDDGQATCLIYGERPGICRKFLCEKARKGMPLTIEQLMERREDLVAQMRTRLAEADQAKADAHAIEGAIQQIDWSISKIEESSDSNEETTG
jgi:Fe-S-cluster containining protein